MRYIIHEYMASRYMRNGTMAEKEKEAKAKKERKLKGAIIGYRP